MPPNLPDAHFRRAQPARGWRSARGQGPVITGRPDRMRVTTVPAAERDRTRDQELPRLYSRRARPLIGRPLDPRIGEEAGDDSTGVTRTDDVLNMHRFPATRVLVIEDNAAFRTAVSLLLIREGYEVLTATDDIGALARVRQWRPHVLLLDPQMPVAEGQAFLVACRAAGSGSVPVVAITADPHTARAMGVDWVLPKPVDFDELLRVVERYTRPDAREECDAGDERQ